MEIGVVPSERSSVLQIYYVAPGATLSQCLVWDRMNALIALLPLDLTGGCVTMVHTTRRILSLLSPHPSSVHIFGTLPPSVSVIRNWRKDWMYIYWSGCPHPHTPATTALKSFANHCDQQF